MSRKSPLLKSLSEQQSHEIMLRVDCLAYSQIWHCAEIAENDKDLISYCEEAKRRGGELVTTTIFYSERLKKYVRSKTLYSWHLRM